MLFVPFDFAFAEDFEEESILIEKGVFIQDVVLPTVFIFDIIILLNTSYYE